ncbi:hypothetical protein [Bacillus atrophaeus]|uniref:hypothetical protein n=1 Tax=Bacillus atrophaeus TaxID=1452 RepID=UPI00227E2D0E|nr:hypothetical protein [Bacillus atrophaeus]MCY8513351.1 hypothetical protein [Bacillus atrophaeus]MCY8991917.1 hypothetical protein [Bacillus atrophaeus]
MNMRNDIHTALRSLFAGTAASLQDSNPTEESSGIQRLLLGKVLRLTGDEHALIQVGDQTIQGKLETKLRPQAYYWFSYDKKPAEQMGRLQVVQHFDQNPATVQEAAGKLLSAISIKPSNTSLLMTSAMLKSNQPITENDIKAAVQWMETLPPAETKKAIETILFTLKRDLPVHEGVLNALHAVKSPVSMNQQLSRLLHAINQDSQPTEALMKLKQAVTALFDAESDIHAERLIRMLGSQAENEGFGGEKAMKSVNDTEGHVSGRRSAPEQIQGTIKPNTVSESMPQQKGMQSAGAEDDIPEIPRLLLEKMSVQAEKNGSHVLKEAAAWIKAVLSQENTKTGTVPSVMQAAQVTDQEADVFVEAVKQAEPSLSSKTDVLAFLSKIRQGLGARDELAFIKAFEQGADMQRDELQSLKLTLHAARTSNELSEPVKREADQLFHKLNGQLFIQQDHPSYSQIVMSFPMFSKNSVQDMTVLFKGQKEPDGKLDPSHCRLLFLLNLESLKETVVDCFVQQNVMTISIETQFDLQSAIDPMVPDLKQSLKEMGYSLSGVVAKKRVHSAADIHIERYITNSSEQELDVRI